MDDFGNSINNYAFLMHDMIWKRIYFFTSAISGGSHVDAADSKWERPHLVDRVGTTLHFVD